MEGRTDFQGIIVTSKRIVYFPWLLKGVFNSYVEPYIEPTDYEGESILDHKWLDKPVDREAISKIGRQMKYELEKAVPF